MRSAPLKEGPDWEASRMLLRAAGIWRSEEDTPKPLIGICSAAHELSPGHARFKALAHTVKESVQAAGGLALEFSIPGVDGLAPGMDFALPSRELIADTLESVLQAYSLDGVVCLAQGAASAPGFWLGAARVNLPALFLSGGPAPHGKENYPYPWTADFMLNAFAEALGLNPPGDTALGWDSPARTEAAKAAGKRILEMVKENLRVRDIVTATTLDNALAADMALGGSADTLLHALALAKEAGIDYPLERINEVAERTPRLVKLAPESDAKRFWSLEDFQQAGGVQAVLKELSKSRGILNLAGKTVAGKSLGQNLLNAQNTNPECVHEIGTAHEETGLVIALKGNLAPQGAVVRGHTLSQLKHTFKGPARIFETEPAALDALQRNLIKAGETVVLRMAGPRGGPGLPELRRLPEAIEHSPLAGKIALVTDGRVSETRAGKTIRVQLVSPEAAVGGVIGLIRDGDVISIDLPERKISASVPQSELEARLHNWSAPEPRVKTGVLARYARLAGSAAHGAVLE